MGKKIDVIEDIFTTPSARRYKKGHVIFHQDDELMHVGFIKKGFVKVYTISNQGDERILLLLGPGIPIPFSLTYRKGTKIKYFYEAFTNCQICSLPRDAIAKQLSTNKEARLVMAEKLEELMIDLTERLEVFESKSAVDKVARLLAYLVKTCGEPITKNVYAIKFKITHQDIASMTGLVRETASIHLKNLENAGVLTQKSKFSVIDLSKLPDE